MHYRGEDLFARESTQRHMLAHLGSDGRKYLGKSDHMIVFGALAYLPEARVVAVLFSTFGVSAGCLNVTLGKRADPDIGPCRRNGERPDAPECLRLGERRAIRPCIGKTF